MGGLPTEGARQRTGAWGRSGAAGDPRRGGPEMQGRGATLHGAGAVRDPDAWVALVATSRSAGRGYRLPLAAGPGQRFSGLDSGSRARGFRVGGPRVHGAARPSPLALR